MLGRICGVVLHQSINYTLGDLDQASDPNLFIEDYSSVSYMELTATKPAGLEREEVLEKYGR